MEESKSQEIYSKIISEYIDSSIRENWMWEKFISFESIDDEMGWTYIKDFVKKKECIIFFNQEEEQKMFKLSSGDDLYYLLSETYGFEFYVTDEMCTYLICFNHHNILYGCGNAIQWIIKLQSKN